MGDLKNLLDDIVKDEEEENNLNSEDEVIPSVDVSEQLRKIMIQIDIVEKRDDLDNGEVGAHNESPGWRDLKSNLEDEVVTAGDNIL